MQNTARTLPQDAPATSEYSVLGKASAAEVREKPYANLVVEDALEASLYDRLVETFPSDETFFNNMEEVKNNQAVRIGALDVIDNPNMSEEWRGFFNWHTSAGFWKEIVSVFGPSMLAEFPQLENKIGKPISEWSVKRRGEEGEADISLDLLFVINTPVTTESSVRPAHVDRKNKIFSGLFYMKQPDDPTPGGDLSLYEFKHGKMGFGGHYARLKDLNETVTVPYGSNKFVSFINSDRAIHGVTPRPITTWTRRYINFVVETPFEAFDLKPLPLMDRLVEGWKRRQSKSSGVNLKLPPPD